MHARFDLDPGKYVIVPCAFKPGDEGEFLLRIFTEKSSEKKGYKHAMVFTATDVFFFLGVLKDL